MKKYSFLITIVLILAFSMVTTRMLASGNINPMTLIILAVVFFGILMLMKPKGSPSKADPDFEKKVRGDFARNAFADDSQNSEKFRAAMNDYSKNLPKSALNKLTKLTPLCQTEEERYAVSMACAMLNFSLQNFKEAATQYTTVMVLHPTSEVALSLGSCQQRLGYLEKAMDSYEYALDLDAHNLDARSALATACVANGDYDTALEHALAALEQDEKNASALATSAICYGIMDNSLMYRHYANLAVDNGYSEKKITDTVEALKKRK